MDPATAKKKLRAWIRSQHLICDQGDFVFETVDQGQLDRFDEAIRCLGGHVRHVKAMGNWPMGPKRSFKVLRAQAPVPRPLAVDLVQYWAERGSSQTRYSEIAG